MKAATIIAGVGFATVAVSVAALLRTETGLLGAFRAGFTEADAKRTIKGHLRRIKALEADRDAAAQDGYTMGVQARERDIEKIREAIAEIVRDAKAEGWSPMPEALVVRAAPKPKVQKASAPIRVRLKYSVPVPNGPLKEEPLVVTERSLIGKGRKQIMRLFATRPDGSGGWWFDPDDLHILADGELGATWIAPPDRLPTYRKLDVGRKQDQLNDLSWSKALAFAAKAEGTTNPIRIELNLRTYADWNVPGVSVPWPNPKDVKGALKAAERAVDVEGQVSAEVIGKAERTNCGPGCDQSAHWSFGTFEK